MQLTVLAGGVGGARFLRGLRTAAPEAQITVVGNTGDDITMHGLYISPDLDIVTYTLAGMIEESQGWGVRGLANWDRDWFFAELFWPNAPG